MGAENPEVSLKNRMFLEQDWDSNYHVSSDYGRDSRYATKYFAVTTN